MNKKGAIFTAIAIILSVLVISAYFSIQSHSITKESELANVKLKNSVYYIKNAEIYFEHAGQQALDEALEKTTNHIITNGFFESEQDYNDYFYGCLLEQNDCVGLNGTLKKYQDFGKNHLNFDELNVIITNDSEMVNQTQPWYVNIKFNISIKASDGYAKWSIPTKEISTNISVLGRIDPTSEVAVSGAESTMNAYKKEDNKIFTRNTSEWKNARTLNDYAETEVYFSTRDGISYLDRLKNVLNTSSCCGIASMVNKNRVNESDDIGSTGHLDYRFYKNIQCSDEPLLPEPLMFDFWYEEDGKDLAKVRSLAYINETTGEYLNGTIVTKHVPVDTGMPAQNEYGEYLRTPPECEIGPALP